MQAACFRTRCMRNLRVVETIKAYRHISRLGLSHVSCVANHQAQLVPLHIRWGTSHVTDSPLFAAVVVFSSAYTEVHRTRQIHCDSNVTVVGSSESFVCEVCWYVDILWYLCSLQQCRPSCCLQAKKQRIVVSPWLLSRGVYSWVRATTSYCVGIVILSALALYSLFSSELYSHRQNEFCVRRFGRNVAAWLCLCSASGPDEIMPINGAQRGCPRTWSEHIQQHLAWFTA